MHWQPATFEVYRRASAVLRRQFGYELFVLYEPLLVAVHGPLSGEDEAEFSVAYLSRLEDASALTIELRDIGLALVESGFDVEPRDGLLRLQARECQPVTLLAAAFDPDGMLLTPSGSGPGARFTRSRWSGLVDAELQDQGVRVPRGSAELLEYLYGSGWREARQRAAAQAVSPELSATDSAAGSREEVYWANFYAHHQSSFASRFCDALLARPDLPRTVVDIGCGDGRDSRAFARVGYRALGLDRSTVGIQHAQQEAEAAGLESRATYAAVDVSDRVALGRALQAARTTGHGGPLLFYLRFFLHSVTADVQHTLLSVISAQEGRGDMLAAEFRTEEDAMAPKVYGGHYRRFQSGPAFGTALREQYGFRVLNEEQGTGLAPYRDEDPYVYRVLALRAETLPPERAA